MSTEGQREESDEDVQKEDKLTVLWEKCIQHSIFVDLSEDESLHFSDLESSLNLHPSQAESATSEASVHLSGSAELSALDDTSSESSVVSSQSERVVEDKSKNSLLHLSIQRPNTVQEELPSNAVYEDPGQNTSDEDQEELPFDDDLGRPYFNQTGTTEGNMSTDGRETVYASPDVPDLLEMSIADRNNFIEGLVSAEHSAENAVASLKDDANSKRDNSCDASKPNKVAPSCPSGVDLNQLLLRHFSQMELLQAGRLIEAETLPEVSLLESLDDTVFSLGLTHKRSENDSKHSESQTSDINQSFCSGIIEEKNNNALKNSSSEDEAESKIDYVAPAAADSIILRSASVDSNKSSDDDSAEDVMMQEMAVPFVRTKSFSEIKYGQGQVHYPLPDFSKVAPKVKIPKAPSGPAKPVPQSSSIIDRAQSSPGMLDVISRVLEDSVMPPEKLYVFTHEDKRTPPALVHHLQAEYDKLLTKYAEAENLIDQMRLGTNPQTSSEIMLHLDVECHHDQLNDGDHQENLDEGGHLGSMASHFTPLESFVEKGAAAPQNNTEEVNKASPCRADEGPSDGERMTAELNDIISQFIQTVKEFKLSVSNLSMSTAEQQMMLRSMMEAQDQLERKYISKKDEHRALEMQNYMGLSRITGTFDPNRLVEGEIFRIGMHLEDIKEMIDKNVCEQISSPQSSSTPTPMKEMLHVKPNSLCMSTPSPPPSLHEGPSGGFSAVGYKMETCKEEEKETRAKETSVVHGDGGLGQSSELVSSDPFLKHTGLNSCLSWSPHGSLEDQNIQTADDEERSSVLSEGIDHSKILACLSGSGSAVIQRQWTPESSHNILDRVWNPEGECVSLSVEVSSSSATPRDSDTDCLLEPPLTASSRIVSPETDSGFGSSYLNISGSDPFQPKHLTESVHTHTEGLSCSDSEGSCSNLQTAIHSVSLTHQQQESPHPSVQTQSSSAAVALECWVESTAKEPSERLQGSESTQPARIHHLPAPAVSTTMDTEKRHSQSYRCSCNSEAILALQSEVSRLKKDLVEGLVQLPHLSQKMDYLTSKYKQDRQERRSKTRPRIHQTSASNSLTRIEAWISSDMDPSMTKGPDSCDTTGSKMMLQSYCSPVGDGRDSVVHSEPEFQRKPHQTLQSHRGTDGSMTSYSLTSSGLKERQQVSSDNKARHTQQTADMGSICSKERWSPFSSPSLQKPLLQVNCGSSSSLPASYKVREPPLQSMSHHRKRSSQSDTALLPSNVYFQQTPSPVSVASKTGSRRGRRRGGKEDDVSRTLDQAIEVARSMKRTTDRMAKRLSADLAKAQLNRKLHNVQYNHWGAGNTHSTDQLMDQSPPSL